MYKVLITGGRYWTDKEYILNVLSRVLLDKEDVFVIHGGARGVDSLAGIAAEGLGFEVKVVQANWKKFGRSAGIIRNREMLDLNPDLVIAFHADLPNSKGTIDCIREAKRRGINVILYTGETEPSCIN